MLKRVSVIMLFVLIAGIGGGGIGFWIGRSADDARSVSDNSAPTTQEKPPGQVGENVIERALTRPVTESVQSRLPSPHAPHFANMQRFDIGRRNVKALVADGPIIWAGTSEGIVRHDTITGKHQIFNNENSGLLSHSIFFLGNIDGQMWAGTYGGGLYILGDETWKNYNMAQGLADAFVYGVAKTSNGDTWIATWSGANRVIGGRLDDPSAWETYTVENTNGGLPNDWVYSVQADRDGDLWFATEGGLSHYNGETWKHWNHDNGLGAPYEKVKDQLLKTVGSDQQSKHHNWQKAKRGSEEVDVAYNANYIVAMYVDSRGRVLCGTWGGGLSILENGEFKRTYTAGEGLAGNYVSMITESADGTIWVGTSQGLSKVIGGTFDDGFVNYDTSDGLFSNYVFSMAFAQDGSPWVGGFGGVVHYANGLN